MSSNFLKRDFPDIDTERIESRPSGRFSIALLLATHGLWLATSLAGLILTITDAYPDSGTVVIASRIELVSASSNR
jgi:hypothetical protein